VNTLRTFRLDWKTAAFLCAFGSALTTMLSISASQTFLVAGLLALLIAHFRSGAKLSFPPVQWPLGLFLLGTFAALALSDNPAAGLPQIRKLVVFSILLLLASTFHRLEQARWLVQGWILIALAAALKGFWQFATRLEAAESKGIDFYVAYIPNRITGFMSHWMTFSGMQMVALLLGLSLLFFAERRRSARIALATACLLIGISILLSLTRGVWLATAAGLLYLLWNWKRWSILIVPLAIALLFVAGPLTIRSRLSSFRKPHGQLDSNQHRIVTWRTGIQMIRAHPWFGLGPEMVGREFNQYIPADVPRPLPDGWYGHLHNIYLQYSAERGIPTMLMLLWLLLATLWRWGAALRQLAAGPGPTPDSRRWLLHGAIAALLGTMISGVTEHNLGDSEVLLLTLSVLCLGYLGCAKVEDSRAESAAAELPVTKVMS
jgi:O-antigen ligase